MPSPDLSLIGYLTEKANQVAKHQNLRVKAKKNEFLSKFGKQDSKPADKLLALDQEELAAQIALERANEYGNGFSVAPFLCPNCFVIHGSKHFLTGYIQTEGLHCGECGFLVPHE